MTQATEKKCTRCGAPKGSKTKCSDSLFPDIYRPMPHNFRGA